jgi:hypothetical protein
MNIDEERKAANATAKRLQVHRIERDGFIAGWLARAQSDGWRPIESSPDGATVLVGWYEEGEFHQMFDAKEEGLWIENGNAYEHFCASAPPGSRGPTQDAPYTHWMPLPNRPKEDGE